LREVALVVVKEILDGVLDGDDVLGVTLVDPLQAGGEGGRLAGAGWPGDEDESSAALEPGLEEFGGKPISSSMGRMTAASRPSEW
jgi:hypothetical protein